MSGQCCKNYDVKRETVEGDMMPLESYQVFKKLLLFLAFIKMVGLIHFSFLPYSKSLNGFALRDQRILFPSNL